MSESKYPDWYHGPRGPSDEVKAQRKISARLKRIEAKLDAIGTAPQRPKADPLTNDIPLRRSEKWPAPVPQTEGEDKAAQLKRNLLAMGYTDDQAQEIATRLALMGGYA